LIFIYLKKRRTQSLKKSSSKKILFIPTLIDPNKINFKISEPCLYVGCLCIDLINDKYSIEDVINIIKNNIENIKISSSKRRSSGWINLSSSVLKNIKI